MRDTREKKSFLKELKRCPFCGADSFLWKSKKEIKKPYLHAVRCCRCHISTMTHEDKEFVIHQWNKRMRENVMEKN